MANYPLATAILSPSRRECHERVTNTLTVVKQSRHQLWQLGDVTRRQLNQRTSATRVEQPSIVNIQRQCSATAAYHWHALSCGECDYRCWLICQVVTRFRVWHQRAVCCPAHAPIYGRWHLSGHFDAVWYHWGRWLVLRLPRLHRQTSRGALLHQCTEQQSVLFVALASI